jgi:hypothetical protein
MGRDVDGGGPSYPREEIHPSDLDRKTRAYRRLIGRASHTHTINLSPIWCWVVSFILQTLLTMGILCKAGSVDPKTTRTSW